MLKGYYELYWNSICLREMFFQVCENGKRVKVMMVDLIEKIYSFLWGDLVHIPLPGGSTLGISLLIILLIPAGIYFTIRTRFLPIRLFPDMVRALVEKKKDKNSLSSFQALLALRIHHACPARAGAWHPLFGDGAHALDPLAAAVRTLQLPGHRRSDLRGGIAGLIEMAGVGRSIGG